MNYLVIFRYLVNALWAAPIPHLRSMPHPMPRPRTRPDHLTTTCCNLPNFWCLLLAAGGPVSCVWRGTGLHTAQLLVRRLAGRWRAAADEGEPWWSEQLRAVKTSSETFDGLLTGPRRSDKNPIALQDRVSPLCCLESSPKLWKQWRNVKTLQSQRPGVYYNCKISLIDVLGPWMFIGAGVVVESRPVFQG